MAIDSRSDAAAAAAAEAARQRAIEEARRRAEEAKEKAAEQARKATEAAKAQSALTKTQPKPKVIPDELSTGRGGALRRGAVSQLAAQGLPTTPAASTTGNTPATFKMSDLVGRTMPSSATLLADPTGGSGTPAATVSDDPETRRRRSRRATAAAAGVPIRIKGVRRHAVERAFREPLPGEFGGCGLTQEDRAGRPETGD